jgi:hypothetical protein
VHIRHSSLLALLSIAHSYRLRLGIVRKAKGPMTCFSVNPRGFPNPQAGSSIAFLSLYLCRRTGKTTTHWRCVVSLRASSSGPRPSGLAPLGLSSIQLPQREYRVPPSTQLPQREHRPAPLLWLDRATIQFRFIGPSYFNTALQLVLRPHFLVHFVWYDLLAILFGPELSSLVLG